MKHVRSLTHVRLDTPSIVTTGNFDGVHRGHQQLIAQQIEQARQRQAQAVALTFFPHPARVIHPSQRRFYLTSPDERAALLGEMGVDLVITHPFDDSVRHTRADVFVNQMLDHLNMCELWVGPDFALGYKREGDVDFLTRMGQTHSFALRVIQIVTQQGKRFSSSAIRDLLRRGAVEQAALNLGRPYHVTGAVVPGAHRGTKLGFPTANLSIWAERLLPASGVYAGWAWAGGLRCAAVTNIGTRPTFDGDSHTVEVHLIDFEGDLYGADLSFDFMARLRDEKPFDNVEDLVLQVKKDIMLARSALGVA